MLLSFRQQFNIVSYLLYYCRSAYFLPATPQGKANLAAFLAGSVEPVFSDGPVAVMSLRDQPR